MSGSVSLVNGHIDSDKNEMTPQQAIKYFEEEILMLENAPNLNGCEMTDEWREQIEICKLAISAIEKQIPKKPYKRKEHKQNDYYCTVCKRYLGDDMELKHACLQPEYCQHCGQALDWSDTE